MYFSMSFYYFLVYLKDKIVLNVSIYSTLFWQQCTESDPNDFFKPMLSQFYGQGRKE